MNGRLVLAMLLAAAPLAAQENGLTIYSDGRVVVRRSMAVQLRQGMTTVPVALGVRELDPGTVTVLDAGVVLRGVRLAPATGQDASLRRALGRDVEFLVRSDTVRRYVTGTLLSLDPPVVRVDGRILYGLPGTPVFPESLVQTDPRVEMSFESPRALSAVRLMYLTQGMAWNADYTLITARSASGQAAVTGAATIENGTMTVRGATVQLLAGDVRRVAPGGPRPVRAMRARALAATEADAPGEEAVGGTHLYTLPGTLDIAPGEQRTVALFDPAQVLAEREYVLRNQNYGAVNPQPDPATDLHPDIGYRVHRPRALGFGQVPLPRGTMRVYEPDAESRPQLVGEVPISHTAAGEDLRLVTGTAFDLTATRTQAAFERRGEREAVTTWRVELANARDEAVTVRVEDTFPGSAEVLSSTVPAVRVSSATVAFPVPVPAGGSVVLEYRVRVRW